MVRVEANVTDDGVKTSTQAEGSLTDILEETTGAIEAMYHSVCKLDGDAKVLWLTVVGELMSEWMHDVAKEHMGGGTYA